MGPSNKDFLASFIEAGSVGGLFSSHVNADYNLNHGHNHKPRCQSLSPTTSSSMSPSAAPGGPSPNNANNEGSTTATSTTSTTQQPQLTMTLMNNLMQMQGLENTLVQQQLINAAASPAGTGAGAGTSSSSSSPSPPNSSHLSTQSSPPTTSDQLLLERQIKLSQLQQLQQLQNQIFQQQIALISGQSGILPTLPLIDASTLAGSGGTGSTRGDQFTGLPTPGPSGEIRPQDFSTPSAHFMDPLPHALVPASASSNNQSSSQNKSPNSGAIHQHQRTHSLQESMNLNLHRQLQAISQQPQPPQQHGSPYLSSTSSSPFYTPHHQFQNQPQHPVQKQHHPSSPSSPVFRDSGATSPMSLHQSPNPSLSLDGFEQHHFRSQQQSFSVHHSQLDSQPSMSQNHRLQQHGGSDAAGSSSNSGGVHIHQAPHSAPESLAFNIYAGGSAGIPGLSLGDAGMHPMNHNHHHAQTHLGVDVELDMDMDLFGAQNHPHLTQQQPRQIAGGRRMSQQMTVQQMQQHPQQRQQLQQVQHHHHQQQMTPQQQMEMQMQMQILDQDISPLTSPWLGARHTASTSTPNTANPASSSSRNARRGSTSTTASANLPSTTSNKRTASASCSGDENSNPNPRKKQSPAIRPTLAMSVVNAANSTHARERERESGSTSPLGLGESLVGEGGSRKKSGKGPTSTTPPPVPGEGGADEGGNKGSPDSTATTADKNSPPANANQYINNSNNATEPKRRPSRGSKSTNATPLLRSPPTMSALAIAQGLVMTSLGNSGGRSSAAASIGSTVKTRSRNGAGKPISVGGAFSLGGGAGASTTGNNDGSQDTPSPVDLNLEVDSATTGAAGSSTASSVDRSMPPPPLPASVAGSSSSSSSSGNSVVGGPSSNPNSNASNLNSGANPPGNGGNLSNMDMDMNMSFPMGSFNFGGVNFGNVNLGSMNGMNMNMNMMGMGLSEYEMGEMGIDAGMGMGMGMDMDMGMSGGDGGSGAGGEGFGMMDMGGMDFGQQQERSNQHMPPPSSPVPSRSEQRQQGGGQKRQRLVPVTPASIMNLGRLGINSASSGGGGSRTNAAIIGNSGGGSGSTMVTTAARPTTATSGASALPMTRQKSTRKDAATRSGNAAGNAIGNNSALGSSGGTIATRSTRLAARRSNNIVSPSLKPLLPAGQLTPKMDSTLPSPMSASTPNTPHTMPTLVGGGAGGIENMSSASSSTATAAQAAGAANAAGGSAPLRKTSHKAAEQKRRDSLKTTFDDLRKLLPPIALPNDADVGDAGIASPIFHPTTPLLPGALPPRGPPKAGGEGPNKGVSKLQLLICGNEYIRLLKGRVERRDEEVARLRREVGRLRGLLGAVREDEGEGMMEEDDMRRCGGEELDLERDLDAVEKLAFIGPSAVASAGNTHNNLNENANTPSKRNGANNNSFHRRAPSSLADDGMDEGDEEEDE